MYVYWICKFQIVTCSTVVVFRSIRKLCFLIRSIRNHRAVEELGLVLPFPPDSPARRRFVMQPCLQNSYVQTLYLHFDGVREWRDRVDKPHNV